MSAGAPDFGPQGLVAVSREARQLVIQLLADERGVHLETSLSGLGALAGVCILRSAGLPLDKLTVGSPVLSDRVDELGPQYVSKLASMFELAGFNPQGGWSDAIPEGHRPLRTIRELTRLLEAPFEALCDRAKVPRTSRVELALFTAVRLVDEGREILNPEIAKAILMTSLVAGSKTVPEPRIGSEKTSKGGSVWSRFFGA